MRDFIVMAIATSICIHINVHQYSIIVAQRATNEILEDQITDYAQQISELRSLPTYSDGIKTGFENASSLEYVSGYHRAIKDLQTSTVE